MSRHRKLTDADVTPESLFHQRRTVLKALGLTAATLSLRPARARPAQLVSGQTGACRPAR